MSEILELDVNQVFLDPRIRQIDPTQVEALKLSFLEVGQINPITVCLDATVGNYRLVAGAHRLEACRANGFPVKAVVMDLTDPERILAECDENLCGPRLTPSDKALFTDRRRKAYEEIYGPAKAVGARAANEAMGRGDASANLAVASFTSDTAAKTGQSERVVRRDAERGDRVISEVLTMIRGTHLDTGSFLDRIKSFPPNDQVAIAKRELAMERREKAQFDPMAIASTKSAPDDEQAAKKLPSYDEMRAAILLLSDLKPEDFSTICPMNKRAAMCSKLAHLQQTFEHVIGQVGS